MDLSVVAAKLDSLIPDRRHCVVLTGGEPMLQQDAINWLALRYVELGHCVEIETAGTIAPDELMEWPLGVRFNVSPKLASSGNELERRYRPEVLRSLCQRGTTNFKFVVSRDNVLSDLAEIEEITQDCGLPSERVWIMPEGTGPQDQLEGMRQLERMIINQEWNLSVRLHVLIWGNERGK